MPRSFVSCCIVLAVSAALCAQTAYVPQRVYVSAKKQFGDFETMLADVARADVVFVGEVHDDPNTHRLELALLQGLARRRGDVVLSLEMFERDVQEPFSHFMMGHTTEAEFLQQARPWPTYAADYKPLVDFAISKDWQIVAANVPRDIAAEVSKSGLDVLKSKRDAEKAWFARDLKCPSNDRYAKRFNEAMGGHAGTSASGATAKDRDAQTRALEFYYEAQCLKDETMGESIAQAEFAGSIGGKRPLVVQINGAFHSDYRDGVVERTRRRLPDTRMVVLTILPVPDLDALAPDSDVRKRADYAVYTVGK